MISFYRKIMFIKSYAPWLIGVPLTAVILTLLLTSKLPKLWEAKVLLQVGQAGGELVEEPSSVAYKLAQTKFLADLMKKSNLGEKELSVLRKSYKVTQMKGASYIEIRLNAGSPAEAQSVLQQVIYEVKAMHKHLYDSEVRRLSAYLQVVTSEAEGVEHALAYLKQQRGRPESKGDALSSYIVLTQVGFYSQLQYQKKKIEEQLDDSHTFMTREIGAIEVSERPVSPNITLIVIVVAVFSLFGTIMAIFLREMDNYLQGRMNDGASRSNRESGWFAVS